MSLWSVDDLGAEGVERVLARAEALRGGAQPQRRPGLVALAFYEASTRTRLGFARAAVDVGATPVDAGPARFAEGMSAPESVADTLRMLDQASDVVILRSPDTDVERIARERMRGQVVNAGIGNREHPSQALVDLFCLRALLGRLAGLRWGVVGDLAGSRAAHSLLRTLRWQAPVEVRLMAPPSRRPEPRWTEGLPCASEAALRLDGLDVLYVAGLPPGVGEGRLDAAERAAWSLDPVRMAALPGDARVLCPLPRIDEIDTACDNDPRAAWFVQSELARWVRIALLERVMCGG